MSGRGKKCPFREEARRLGKRRYFSGEMCVRGHVAYRRTDNGGCVLCQALETKARRSSPLGIVCQALSTSKGRARKHGGLPINPITIWPYPDDNKCELCGQLPKSHIRLHADHEHYTGQFRGWICYRCNSVLGNMEQIGPGRISEYIQGLEYANATI